MWLVNLLKNFWHELTISYIHGLPDLEDIPPSGHGEWVRYPTKIESNVQPPTTVEVKPVLVSARERSQFHQMRIELLKDASWPSSQRPVNTEPINISDIKTQPVERNTLEVPALTNKLIHGRHKKS